MSKHQRNAPCSCGSAKKYKNCCGAIAKPVGSTGLLNLSFNPAGIKTIVQNIEFPRSKAEIEKFVVTDFLKTAQSEGLFGAGQVQPVQNEENNFDYTLNLEK